MRYVLVQENDQSVLTSCFAKELQNTECQCTRDHLLNAAVQAHHQVYGTGTRTLATLSNIWIDEMKDLKRQGIPKIAVISGFQQAVELCLYRLDSVTFSIGNIQEEIGHIFELKEIKKKESKLQNTNEKKTLRQSVPVVVGTMRSDLICSTSGNNSVGAIGNNRDEQKVLSSEQRFNENDDFMEVELTLKSNSKECYKDVELLNIVEPIELKMTQPEEIEDINEDIGWFFDDGKVPLPPEIDESVTEAIIQMQLPNLQNNDVFDSIAKNSKCSFEKNMELTTSRFSRKNDKTTENVIEQLNAESEIDYFERQSIKQDLNLNDDCDEFADSFEDVEIGTKSNSLTKTKVNVTKKLSSKNKSGYFESQSIKQEFNMEDDDYDEFAACFNDAVKPVNAVVTSKNKTGYCEQQSIKQDIYYEAHDDEFADCFNDNEINKTPVKPLTSVTAGKTNASISGSSQACNNSNTIVTNAINSTVTKSSSSSFSCIKSTNIDQENDDIEFDDCFKSNILQEEWNTLRSGSIINPNNIDVLGEKTIDIHPIGNLQAPVDNDKQIKEDFANKLQSLLNKKQLATKEKILNRSRHYRNIDRSIQELEQKEDFNPVKTSLEESYKNGPLNLDKCNKSCSLESKVPLKGHKIHQTSELKTKTCKFVTDGKDYLQNALLTSNKLNNSVEIQDKLKTILETKSKPPVPSKILNRSRHFKSVQTTVKEFDEAFSQEQQSLSNSKKDINKHLKDDNPTVNSDVLTANTAVRESHRFDKNLKHMPESLQKVVLGLCRGNDENVECLTSVINGQQFGKTNTALKDVRLDLKRIHTLAVTGGISSKNFVIKGLIVKTNTEQMVVIDRNKLVHKRCLLINGDISSGFRHRGFKQTQKVQLIKSSPAELSKEDLWLEEVMKTLNELSIQVVLLKGTADSSFVQLCLASDVIVLTEVPYRVLLAIGEVTGAVMTTYITECTKENVACNVYITPIQKDWMDVSESLKDMHLTAITIDGCMLQSVLFTHPVEDVALDNEEIFWHSAHRIASALENGKILLGSGTTEYYCYELLNNEADILESRPQTKELTKCIYLPTIYRSVAKGFLQFYFQIQKRNNNIPLTRGETNKFNCKSQENGCDKFCLCHSTCGDSESQENGCDKFCFCHSTCGDSEIIYDDFIITTETWKSALQFAAQIFNTDVEVITGHSDSISSLF